MDLIISNKTNPKCELIVEKFKKDKDIQFDPNEVVVALCQSGSKSVYSNTHLMNSPENLKRLKMLKVFSFASPPLHFFLFLKNRNKWSIFIYDLATIVGRAPLLDIVEVCGDMALFFKPSNISSMSKSPKRTFARLLIFSNFSHLLCRFFQTILLPSDSLLSC